MIDVVISLKLELRHLVNDSEVLAQHGNSLYLGMPIAEALRFLEILNAYYLVFLEDLDDAEDNNLAAMAGFQNRGILLPEELGGVADTRVRSLLLFAVLVGGEAPLTQVHVYLLDRPSYSEHKRLITSLRSESTKTALNQELSRAKNVTAQIYSEFKFPFFGDPLKDKPMFD